MFRQQSSPQRSMLGIEITPATIKIVELSNRNASYQLENYAFCSLPEGVIQHDKIRNSKAIINCLKGILASTKFSTNSAVLALPDSAVTSKVLQFSSALTKRELEEAVIDEVLLRHPAPPNEINIDFSLLDSTSEKAMMNVLVVATNAENVRARIELCRGVGLNAKIVDVEAFAVHRLLRLSADHFGNESTANVAVIDANQAGTRLFVLEAHKPKVTLRRELAAGSLDDKVNEVKEILKAYAECYSNYPINHLIVTGDYKNRENLENLLAKQLEIQIKAVNLFSKILSPPQSTATNNLEFGQNYLVACGLALRLPK